MSFNMNTKDIAITDENTAMNCLQNWSKYVGEIRHGSMTVNRKGKFVEVKITKHDETKSTGIKLSNIWLHHTYKYIHEYCSSGMPEISKHFNLKVNGKDKDNRDVKLSLYINHTCEDGRTWSKDLSFLID